MVAEHHPVSAKYRLKVGPNRPGDPIGGAVSCETAHQRPNEIAISSESQHLEAAAATLAQARKVVGDHAFL
jgi:hypothetical protein